MKQLGKNQVADVTEGMCESGRALDGRDEPKLA